MQSSYYITALAGDINQRNLATINHNLANVSTIGYMANRASFASKLAEQQNIATPASTHAYSSYSDSFIDMGKGSIRQTGNDLDFAIQGNGFFTVKNSSGKLAYTRAGNFTLDANGTLLTQAGLRVLSDNGSPILLPTGHITANSNGTLLVNGQPVSRLALVTIKDPSKLQRIGDTLLTTPKSNTATVNDSTIALHQGALEQSNVNAVLGMTEMIVATRKFDSTMKVIDQYNLQTKKLYNQVGLVR